jgi:Flp pilus assembly pilin Flp
MKNNMNKIKSFLVDEKGAETAEWAVVVAILTAVALAAYGPTASGTLGTAVKLAITNISNAITTG